MERKFTKGELNGLYGAFQLLENVVLSGEVAQALVETKRDLEDQLDVIEEVHKSIILDFCRRDEKGEAVKERKTVKGQEVYEYSFETIEKKEECAKCIADLMKQEAEIKKAKIPADYLKSISCSVQQMEILLTLTTS